MSLFVLRQGVLAAGVFVLLTGATLFPAASFAVPIAEGGDSVTTEETATGPDDVVTNDVPPAPVVVERDGKSDLPPIQSGKSSNATDTIEAAKPKSSLLALYREWKAERELQSKPVVALDVAALAPAFVIDEVGLAAVPAPCFPSDYILATQVNKDCPVHSLY